MPLVPVIVAALFFCAHLSASPPDHARQLVGHGGPVNSIAVNHDGSRALSGSLDYSVILWDLAGPSPRPLHRFLEHRGAVSEVRFVPNGDQAVSAGDDGTIYLWDTGQQRLLHRFSGHQAKVVSIDFSPDGSKMASASWDGSLRVWDLPSRQAVTTIEVHRQTLHAVLLSGNGRRVYSAGHDGQIREWNIATGQMLRVLHNHGWPINLMRWLPDERIVFGTANGDVQVLDLASGRIDKVLIPHSKPVLGLSVSDDGGLIATGGNDGTIRVWRINDWSLSGETHGIPGPVWALAFTDDNRGLWFGSLDDAAGYWPISADDDTDWAPERQPRRFQVTSGMPAGELQFARKCSVCHDLDPGPTNRAGPSLHKVLGRRAGTLPGYAYSDALRQSSLVWDRDNIERLFVQGPHIVVPGSKMPLQKIPNARNRAALIDFLAAQ